MYLIIFRKDGETSDTIEIISTIMLTGWLN